MLRLFVLFLSLFFNLQASCKGGYDSCKQKIIDSESIKNQTIQIPITKYRRLVFSNTTPAGRVIKHDPFLSLYLVEDKKGFKYPFRINNNLSLGKAAVNDKMAIEGKILKQQIGLNKFAQFSESVNTPSILINSCCALEGLVTKKGIIDKRYIQRFLKTKDVSYSDIGIRVIDEKDLIIVNAIDPFMKNNKFLKDDCILSFDGKKVKDSASLMRKILFAKIGSTHKVKIKRKDKIFTITLRTKKRYSAGSKSDTFLEQYGLEFDKNLKIIAIKAKTSSYGLKIGDKLIQINGKKVQNQRDIIENILDFKDNVTLLFERRGFQFFVHLN